MTPGKLRRRWLRWKLKYTSLLLISLVAFYFIAKTETAKSIADYLGSSGYIGALAGGVFFVSSYTVAPSAFILHAVGQHLGLVMVALLGGLGAMVGDYLIFRFTRDRIAEEWRPYLKKIHRKRVGRPKKTFIRKWGTIILGGLIIASPLPDEVGVGLLGLSKMRVLHFLGLVYILNSTAILAVLLIARSL